MQVFENIATILAYSSISIFFICIILSLIIYLIGFSDFSKKFDKFYFKVDIYFCLPLYGLSFISEGISEKMDNRNPTLNFVMAIVFFLIMFILINRKKIKKIIERRKFLWKFWR